MKYRRYVIEAFSQAGVMPMIAAQRVSLQPDIFTEATDIGLTEKLLLFSCSAPVDIIELEMKSLIWFQLILWFGSSGSKAEGICGLYAEVIGLIAN